jgi:23S rRNA (cytidine1920-2'-O)/16S rRNA (cytidine1409-2'-O)-methyltransferase
MEHKKKERLDTLLVNRGLVQSRERAKALIMTGNVLVNDVPETKAGAQVFTEDNIRLRAEDFPYVSRSALKLLGAVEKFAVRVEGKTFCDVGSSTGGFTQVLLEKGAKKVYAVDVGTNQLAWKLRSDSRVVSMEQTNARHLTRNSFPEKIDAMVMDVSFISITKMLNFINDTLDQDGYLITLVKPQFELEKSQIGKGGIVEHESLRLAALESVTQKLEGNGWARLDWMWSPLSGADGNVEILSLWKKK